VLCSCVVLHHTWSIWFVLFVVNGWGVEQIFGKIKNECEVLMLFVVNGWGVQ